MFLRMLLASMTRRLSRKLLAAGSIWVGVTLIVALLHLGIDVGDAMNREMQSFGANIRLEPLAQSLSASVGGYEPVQVAGGLFLQVSELARLRTIFWKNNILGISPELRGQATLAGRKVPVVGVWFDHTMQAPDAAPFRTGARQVYKHWQIAGDWPEETADPPECLVGDQLARKRLLRPGASIVLTGPGAAKRLRVTGILSSGDEHDRAVVAGLATVQQLLGRRDAASAADISALTTPENILAKKYRKEPKLLTAAQYERWYCTPYPGSVAADIQKAIPGSVARVVRRISETQGALLTRIEGLTYLLIGLAFVVCCLAVMGVITSAVLERRQEVALLQAIGAKRWDVVQLFVAEATAGGLAGGGLAALSGITLGSWLMQAVFGTGSQFHLLLACLAPVLGVGVAWGGGVWPVWRAMNRSTAVVLHGN